MSYGKIDPTDGDFALIEFKIRLNTYQSTWTKDFSISTQGKNIHWRLTLLRSVYDKCIVYLTFISDKGKRFCNKVNVKFDFYITFGDYGHIPKDETIKGTTTNIFSKDERVSIYTSKFKSDLSFWFSFQIRGTMKEISGSTKFPINIETIPANVLKNMEAFFMDQKFCDVTFQTADACISAHKNILAAQSPVFKCMFSSQMLEKTPGTVINLENIEGVVLKEMFRFIYGGRVENIEKMADKLLTLANKYDVQLLITLCEKVLYEQLTTFNAISTLKIAELHNAKTLRNLTEEFIIKNKTFLFETAEFKSLMSTNPEMVIDILKAEP